MVQASSPHRFVTWPYLLNRKDRIILLTTTQFSEWTMWTGPFAFFCTEEWMILPVTPSIRYIPTKVRSWCVSVLSVTTASRFGFNDYSSRKKKQQVKPLLLVPQATCLSAFHPGLVTLSKVSYSHKSYGETSSNFPIIIRLTDLIAARKDFINKTCIKISIICKKLWILIHTHIYIYEKIWIHIGKKESQGEGLISP